jgi:hypothetical protein
MWPAPALAAVTATTLPLPVSPLRVIIPCYQVRLASRGPRRPPQDVEAHRVLLRRSRSVDALDGHFYRAGNVEYFRPGNESSESDDAGRRNRQSIVPVEDDEVPARPPITQIA